MLLSPSLSPTSPQDSPSTTSPPPVPPPPEVLPPVAPPVLSPPSPSPGVFPPLVSPPLAPNPAVVPATPPSFLPEVAPSTPAIAVAPVAPPLPAAPAVVASPQPPLPPPEATTITPVALSPQPQPPLPPAALVLTPPPLPPPPVSAPPPQASIPLPLTSPPPSLSVVLPPQPTVAPSLPPPTPPITDPPPFTLVSPPPSPPFTLPNAPASFESKQSPLPARPRRPPPPPPALPLAVGKGGLPEIKHGSHSPTGLIVSCVGVGIILFALLTLVCICCKIKRKHKPWKSNEKQQCLMTKDDFYAAPTQHEEEEEGKVGRPTPEVHVITVPALLPPPPQTNAEGSVSVSGSRTSGQDSELSSSSGIFSYEELVAATDGFSESNLLGQGGFGYVHKGVLASGQEVAVKKLKVGSLQGEREFQAEVETVSRVHHKHLVSLVGYCITGPHRLLVYEFVPNKTLEFHLHGDGQPVMLWESRLKIAIGSAKGIAYLHEDCNPAIVHRDIKAANILLDSRFEAKVSDFGLAKTFPDGNFSISHVSTRVVGTFGYLAPEYALTGKLTDKSDVYSYGVMLLELITGSPPIIKKESSLNQSLVDLARPLLARAVEEDDFDALVDPRLHGSYDKSEMARMVACASACIRHSAWLRPRMSQVFRVLAGDISLSYLNEGARSLNSSMYSSETSIQYEEKRKNMSSSKSCGISGCSRTTSEYGLHPSDSSSESQSIV